MFFNAAAFLRARRGRSAAASWWPEKMARAARRETTRRRDDDAYLASFLDCGGARKLFFDGARFMLPGRFMPE